MEILLVFTEPQHAIEIEDGLEGYGYTLQIIHTPIELLDVNPFYCKTTLKILNPDTDLIDRVTSLPVADLFHHVDGRFVSAHPILEGV
ncbi:hypothetical protein [Paenibacillus sp. Y412MC10]|uniref:hypothetical protein n=1 Tax=Geobacillus sp. (strain Y412MC10) TaxID=481743 RepID=UPI0011AB4A68|nr:hypothetical protein [Paenibacillus sp. Y412MC10]